MERRYSFSNSPRLLKPTAESTWITGLHGPQRSVGHIMQRSLGSRERSNSSTCLSSNETLHRSLHQISRISTSVSKMTRQKLNLSQLDPRTYADVNSSGLASRIVEYQQNRSRGLQRSNSTNNVYDPITQPRRCSIAASPIAQKPRLPSVSMTRIAPPERSFYCGNTLSSLLRSNSLLGVEKNSEQLSRENRPIIHPHPLQHENEPTRSVLEELKEISRKRINSGEIQPSDYNRKKSKSNRTTDPHHHLSMLQPQPSFKRQRELTVAVPLRLHHPATALPQQHQSMLSAHSFSARFSQQQSPEQLAKRRNCSYSNDIASSLSSSQLHNNKRKLHDLHKVSNTSGGRSSGSSPETSPCQHGTKIQRNQPTNQLTDVEHEKLSRVQSTPITPLPWIPAQRTISAPEVQTKTEILKPKLTLFNAKQPEQNAKQEELDLSSRDVDANEYAGIQFVQPKRDDSTGVKKNSHLERTQKSKLALMLSSLRGEIYQDETEVDETDTSKHPILTMAVEVNVPTTIATKSPTAALEASTTTVATTKLLDLPTTKPVQVTSTISTTEKAATTTGAETTKAEVPAIASSISPLTTSVLPEGTTANSCTLPTLSSNKDAGKGCEKEVAGASTLPSLPVAAETGNKVISSAGNTSATPVLSLSTSKTMDTASTPAPILPSFTFGKPTAITTVAGAASKQAELKPILTFGNVESNVGPSPSLGQNSEGQTSSSLASPINSSMNSAAYGSVPAPETTLKSLPTQNSGVFTFGTVVATGAEDESATAATVNKPFTFAGSSTNTAAPSTVDNAVLPAKEPISFGSIKFGSTFTNVASPAAVGPVVSQATVAKPANIFSFVNTTATPPATSTGSGVSAMSSATTTSQPIFKFGSVSDATSTSAANSQTIFSFGTACKPTAKATPFSFGSSGDTSKMEATQASPVTVAQSFNFITTTTGTTATTSVTSNAASSGSTNIFNFNSSVKQTPLFGSSNTTATKPFTFGGAVEQQQQQQRQEQQEQHPRTGGFSFGALTPKNEGTNVFNSPIAGATVVKPSFNFGSNATVNAGMTTTPANVFGGFAAPAPPSTAATPNQNIFTFGNSSTSNNVASSGSSSLFANASNVQQQTKPGAFSFSSSTNSDNKSAANSNSPFTFGGAPSPQQNTNNSNVSKPFTFGSNANNSTTTNIFGSPAAVTNGAPFSFSNSSGGGGGATAPTATLQQNPFAPPSLPGNRPIRRATRRLQK